MSRLLVFINIILIALAANSGYLDPGEALEEHQEEISEDDIDLTLKPNEMGKVMILMFHSIEENDGVWKISKESFVKNLEYLFENNYYLVSLEDYIKGQMDVPAGKTPVIFTFDDGLKNNFKVIEENGELIIDPDSAVGIMEEFKRNNPDFNSTATFYLFGTNPFRQKKHLDFKLNYLVENCYDVGNHTYDHAFLNKIKNKEEILFQLGEQEKFINEFIPEYEINTLSLPYGLRPDEDLEKYLIRGEYEGLKYEHIGILDVGSNPSYSWADKRFNFKEIPRIRVSRTDEYQESEEWYEYFEMNYDLRYISDGVKDILTVPEDMREYIDEEKIRGKEINIYNREMLHND